MSYIVRKFKVNLGYIARTKVNLGYVARTENNNKEESKDFPQTPGSIFCYRILPFQPHLEASLFGKLICTILNIE